MTPDISQKPTTLKDIARFVLRRVAHIALAIIPKRRVFSEIEKLSTRYNNQNTKAMTCVCFPKMYCEYAKTTDLFPLKEIKFEDIVVLGPSNMCAYLTNHYGDFMKLPPMEQRVGHRPYLLELPKNKKS